MQSLVIKEIQYLKINGTHKQNGIIIFLPGLGAYKENYIEFTKQFKPYYNIIYILDLPEQGSKGAWTIGSMVANLKEFIKEKDNESIKEIHLAGHSAGALAILSFMLNYNKEVEDYFIANELNDINKRDRIKKALDIGFVQKTKNTEKISKLTLYAPVDKFENVISKNKINRILKIKQKTLKIILDICVNIPMLIFSVFTKNKNFKFKLHSKKFPQYFGFVMQDYKSFLKYVKNYKTIFEIYELSDGSTKKQISDRLNELEVVIQFGSLDWLLKSTKRNKATMLHNFKMNENMSIVEHTHLGHLLSSRFSLDINLKKQMLTNKKLLNGNKRV